MPSQQQEPSAELSLVLAEGNSKVNFIIHATDDLLAEAERDYKVFLNAMGHSKVGISTLTVTIPSNDPPRVSAELEQDTIKEGNSAMLIVKAQSTPIASADIQLKYHGDDNRIVIPRPVLSLGPSRLTAMTAIEVKSEYTAYPPTDIVLDLQHREGLIQLKTSTIGFTIPADSIPLISFASTEILINEGASQTVTIDIDPPFIKAVILKLSLVDQKGGLTTDDLQFPKTVTIKPEARSTQISIVIKSDKDPEDQEQGMIGFSVLESTGRPGRIKHLSVIIPAHRTDDTEIRIKVKVYLEGALP